ncbi:latrophilin Cirl-like [Acanthaster planci]|uniref:Latrophilin Cirl-like n=1 Tax=Acanthaster planci TaxID=133434 RepID=A0A8B8A0C8_ACAPL|nr:latrophilin Cirl-like [Acanthaster planci]
MKCFCLLLSGVLMATASCNICYTTSEPDANGHMRWALPYPNPCQCHEIRPGHVIVREPQLPFQPRHLSFLVISGDRDEIRRSLNLEAPLMKTLVCENNKFSIKCGKEETIDVKWALYGRETGTSDCHINKPNPGGNATASLLTVKDKCQARNKCELIANNALFGDPLPNVGKYLVVHHTCICATVCVQ